MQHTFKTPRLIIRQYKKDDAYSVWQVVSQNKIYKTTYAIPHPYPRERVDWWFSFVKNNMRRGTSYEYGIFNRITDEYIGNVGLINIQQAHHSCSISYFIDPKHWNMGYATEAADSMLKFGFYNLKMKRISGRCMAHNIGSASVMKKLGFKFEGRGRCEILKDGEFIDVDHYSILDTEFFEKNPYF